MNENKEIIKKFKKLILEIKKHNKYYYIKDKPKITDAKFDQIKISALDLEKKYPYLKKYESVSNIIGAEPSNKFNKRSDI